jgi:HK97 family phage portal protein
MLGRAAVSVLVPTGAEPRVSGGTPYDAILGTSEAYALAITAVRRCVILIADAIAGREWTEWRGARPVPPSRLVRRPYQGMTRREWVWRVTATLALYDHAFLWMIGGVDPEGVPGSLQPIPPGAIGPEGHTDLYGLTAPARYRIGNESVSAEELVRIPRTSWPTPDPWSRGVLTHARVLLASALAADAYAFSWWAEGAAPSTVLTTDQELNETQAETLADRWVARRSLGRGRPAVLGKGAHAEPFGADPTTEAAVEARRELVADIARLFGVPSHLVNAPTATSLTYATAESNSRDLIRYTLDGYAGPIADAISDLLPGEYVGGRRVRIDFTDLTVGDMAQRYTAWESALRAGWISVPEVRIAEGWDPIPPVELAPKPEPAAVEPGTEPAADERAPEAEPEEAERAAA